MSVDSREVLSFEASQLLRRAVLFDHLPASSSEATALVAIGLLHLRFGDHPEAGYIITPLGIDVVHGVGPFRLADNDGQTTTAAAPVS